MNLDKLLYVYQEEAGGEGGDPGGGGDKGGSLLDGAKPGDGGNPGGSSDDPETWYLAEGVKGEGEAPEYLVKDKYKTLADQAKAYPELAKKLGAHTGAPDEYDISLPEGSSEMIELDPENEGVKAFLDLAKEQGINQEFMSEAMALHVAAMEDIMGELLPNREAELAALGKNALNRIGNLADWGQANLSEEQYGQLKSVTTTAAGVELVETLVGMARQTKIPTGDTPKPDGMTAEKLREMRYAKDDAGHLKINMDPAYKKQVDQAYKDFHGEGETRRVVG